MARDNSPKERQRQQLERKLARRASYDRILIVSEGSKTEPNYFGEIRQAYLVAHGQCRSSTQRARHCPYPGGAVRQGIV